MSRHPLAFAVAALLLATGAARAELPFSHPAVAGHAEPVLAVLQARDASPVLVEPGHQALDAVLDRDLRFPPEQSPRLVAAEQNLCPARQPPRSTSCKQTTS